MVVHLQCFEDHSSRSLVLVLDKLLGVILFLARALVEELGDVLQGDVVAVKVLGLSRV